MSESLKGLIDAEDDYAIHGRDICRRKHSIMSELSTHEYNQGYFDYLYNKHEREMRR